MNSLRFRQIHLDFHTSPLIPNIGEAFDAWKFADTLKNAHVDSVTCFARCHHGMLYYDSKLFPERIHPHIKCRNMLEEMVAACHKRDIRVPIYVTVQWDYFTAQQHPEWICIDENGKQSGTPPYEAGFYQTLCVNTGYRDFLFRHVLELMDIIPDFDGFFFDIVYPKDCSCTICRQKMQNEGIDLTDKQERMAYALRMMDGFKREMSELIRERKKEATIFYNTSHIGTQQRPVSDAYTHFELETLPSGDWGYQHFPVTMRYARTLGLPCLAHTGKFHTEWGDFHSFENPAALEYECMRMVAMGSSCLIGDQMEPGGALSTAVYQLISPLYAKIEEIEPWCVGAQAVSEIAIISVEEFKGANRAALPDCIVGAERMLDQLALQFDIVDTQADFSLYRLLILPDEIPVNEELGQKLSSYLAAGGKLLATFTSGMNKEQNTFSLTQLGVEIAPEALSDYARKTRGIITSSNNFAEYMIPCGAFCPQLPRTEHVMYARGIAVHQTDGECLAITVASYFDRDYKHFCSHRQAPSSGRQVGPAIISTQQTIYFSHPVFSIYNIRGPLWCKHLVREAIFRLLPKPLIEHNGPASLFVTYNRQAALGRDVLHLLHYIPERRCREIDLIEDIIPLYNLEFKVRAEKRPQEVYLAPSREQLSFAYQNGTVNFTVPSLHGHQIICLQFTTDIPEG